MYGSFNEEVQQVWDFVRCQRANGSFYGTAGRCKSGDEVGTREVPEAKPRKAKAKPAPKAPAKKKPVKAKAKPKTKTSTKPKAKTPAAPKLSAKAKKALDAATPEQLEKLSKDPRVKPEQKKILQEAVAKKREGAYTPKEGKGPTGEKAEIKKGVFGENKTFDPDALRKRAEEVSKDKKLKKWDREERVEDLSNRAKQAEKNKEFLDNLSKNVPKGTKLEAEENMVVMTTTTKSGHSVQTTYSPTSGYNFKVNDSYNSGSIEDRRAQMEIASEVRKQYDAFVKSLPPGTIVKTSAYDKDGKGEGRQSLYERMGFSSAKPGDPIFAVKEKDGTMTPVQSSNPQSDWQGQAFNTDSMWFNETDSYSAKNGWQQDDFWRRLIFGDAD